MHLNDATNANPKHNHNHNLNPKPNSHLHPNPKPVPKTHPSYSWFDNLSFMRKMFFEIVR